MICSRLPQCIVSLHFFKADQDILQSLIQCMPHMEFTRNIGRRNHDRKRFFAVIHFCMKIFVVKPLLV